jgi:CheY-like chemotaxis protein/anti-sigma regulatory factor (Ser/Thr protein kinase)
VPVAAAIDEVLSLVRPLADQRGITIDETAAAASSLAVCADPRRLRQILFNVVQNAVKYNVQGGRIEVRAHRTSDGLVRIAVRDTGPGIPPEALDRIFVPFERASEADVEGTGLGLPISLRLARAMGGRIDVDSRPGSGSTFTVALPETAASVDGDAVDAEGDAAPAPAEVLYIEDNVANVRLVERALADRDVVVRTAPTVQQGLALARGPIRPALVLLDLHLPDGQGTDVLEALRADAELHDVPIVVVSSDAMPATARRLLDAGASEYLTKPLDLPAFLATVDGLLAQR